MNFIQFMSVFKRSIASHHPAKKKTKIPFLRSHVEMFSSHVPKAAPTHADRHVAMALDQIVYIYFVLAIPH